LSEFFLGVGSSVAAVALLAFLASGRSTLNLSWNELRLLWSTTRRMRRNGIMNFFAKRSDYIKHRKEGTIPEYISLANRDLLYVGFWLAHGVDMSDIRNAMRELLERGCRIELIVINPENGYGKHLAEYLAMTPESLKIRIAHTVDQMREFRKSLTPELKTNFSIRTHTKLITASAFVLDRDTPKARILVDFKLYNAGRDNTFGIEFQAVQGKDKLYSRILDSLMKIRNSASTLED
jgi:hypothetical protein